VCSPLRRAFERALGEDRALPACAGLRLDMQNPSRLCRRNARRGRRNVAPPPPKPRGGPRALAGEGARAIQARCPCPHTRSVCAQSPAQTEQWYCWFCAWRIIFGSAAIAAIPAISEMTNIRQECPGIKSELRPRNASAQTRIVSVARIPLDSRKSARSFKGPTIAGNGGERERISRKR
jgi:hypothetical protein